MRATWHSCDCKHLLSQMRYVRALHERGFASSAHLLFLRLAIRIPNVQCASGVIKVVCDERNQHKRGRIVVPIVDRGCLDALLYVNVCPLKGHRVQTHWGCEDTAINIECSPMWRKRMQLMVDKHTLRAHQHGFGNVASPPTILVTVSSNLFRESGAPMALLTSQAPLRHAEVRAVLYSASLPKYPREVSRNQLAASSLHSLNG